MGSGALQVALDVLDGLRLVGRLHVGERLLQLPLPLVVRGGGQGLRHLAWRE